MSKKYASFDEAAAANPEHPVIVHGLHCRAIAAYSKNIARIENATLSYFNK